MVRPALLTVVLPVVRLVATRSGLVAMVRLVPFCVMAMLLPAVVVTVAPGATLATLVPETVPVPLAAVVVFQPALATALTAFSWFTFVASVPATPGATFVMTVLPALMPAVVTLGPPVMVKPALLTVVLPVVTLVKLGVAEVAIRTSAPFCVMAMLLPAV
jgi:hypothetical protein